MKVDPQTDMLGNAGGEGDDAGGEGSEAEADRPALMQMYEARRAELEGAEPESTD